MHLFIPVQRKYKFCFMKTVLPALFFLISVLLSVGVKAQHAESMVNYIKSHKTNTSLYLIRNDSIIAGLNADQMMPLASTMKILVAVEFAKQASFKVFDTSKMVALSDLDKYYLPLTDGGAHTQWTDFAKKQGQVKNDSVSLLNVARGMITFSSNANTEYLIDLLGEQNVNGNYKLMGVGEAYTPVYYPVSSLFLYQNPKKEKEEDVLNEISSLSTMDYVKACNTIHLQLKNDPDYKAKFKTEDLTPAMQKVWSDRLPLSSTRVYARIGYVLNNRKVFSPDTYAILEKILETMMENPANQQWLVHAGMKGGSTMYVLTKEMYATLKNGTRLSFAYFFNNLDPADQQKLLGWMNDFELAILTQPDFYKELTGL